MCRMFTRFQWNNVRPSNSDGYDVMRYFVGIGVDQDEQYKSYILARFYHQRHLHVMPSLCSGGLRLCRLITLFLSGFLFRELGSQSHGFSDSTSVYWNSVFATVKHIIRPPSCRRCGNRPVRQVNWYECLVRGSFYAVVLSDHACIKVYSQASLY